MGQKLDPPPRGAGMPRNTACPPARSRERWRRPARGCPGEAIVIGAGVGIGARRPLRYERRDFTLEIHDIDLPIMVHSGLDVHNGELRAWIFFEGAWPRGMSSQRD